MRVARVPIMLTSLVATAAAWQAEAAPQIAQQTYRLGNGLTVILSEDHQVPVVHVEMWYRTGARDDPPGGAGTAHLLEHVLVARDVDSGLIEAGASNPFAALTFADHTAYQATLPAHELERALWVE